MADDLPVVITAAGLQPSAPADIRANLLASVAAVSPGYTANLPGILIEDVADTEVASIVQSDNARVETVNSLTPLGANNFLLVQQGNMLGVPIGLASNTSVFVQFSSNSPGFNIGKGFQVSDGNFTYQIIDGGNIGSDGTSPLLFALATVTGSWAVPPGTVKQIVTSVPATVGSSPLTLTVVNPEAGLPGASNETSEDYRARVQTANLAASQGMTRYLKTLVENVSGVQPRLVSVQIQGSGTAGGWKVIVGGGDPYQVGYAIFDALFDVSNIVGSLMVIETATSALPSVIGTLLNHGYTAGQAITIASASPVGFNGNFGVYSVTDEKTFVLGKFYIARNLSAQSWGSGSGGTLTFTTVAPHGVTIGSMFTITGSTPSGFNGTFTAAAGTTGSTLVAMGTGATPGASSVLGSLVAGVAWFDASALSAYVSGTGIITPNFRNITVSLIDYPDTYPITFINPPQQTVTMNVIWNTDSPNFVSASGIAQQAAPAIAAYVNSVIVGQPMNLLQLNDAFIQSVEGLLPAYLISKLVFSIDINGVGTAPVNNLITGDPESYFFAIAANISVVQG